MSNSESLLFNETIERAKYFQNVHVWPLSEDLNYDGWLNNFKAGEERDIACTILGSFSYYSSKMVDQMLRSSVSSAGHIFLREFTNWKHSDFKRRCFYSFIPGENPNPTDSGHLFARKLRDSLGVPENRIVNYSNIAQILDSAKDPCPIIFVDDFVGSGAQVYKAWIENQFSYNKKTLSETCRDGNHCAVYAPLFVNHLGFNIINNHCKGLHLCPAHILGEEYCLFNFKGFCWKSDIGLFNKGISLILKKSREIGIPFTNGQATTDVRGFQKQALSIAFEHGAPDATLPIFYWADNWTPLISKRYQR